MLQEIGMRMLIKCIFLLTDNRVRCMKLLGAAQMHILTETKHNIIHQSLSIVNHNIKNLKSTLQVSTTVTVELLLTNCHRWIVP